MVSLVDLPPTLLDAAGVTPPASMQGQSILSMHPTPEDDVFIQVSEDHVGRALRTRRWKYEVIAPDAHGWNDMNASLYREAHLFDLEAERLLQRLAAAGEAIPQIAVAV
jgi:arylsulfatase A-like enzyme